MNTGIPYELVVQSIFQEIVDQEFANTIKVEHNTIEQGRITSHQIDVLWRFSVADIIYTTVVQAKDWASRITKEKVLAFWGVLNDLPGQPRGVMVTQTGFQAGAKKLAEAHDIKLYLLQRSLPPQANMVLTDISYATISIDIQTGLIHRTIYRPIIQSIMLFIDPSSPTAQPFTYTDTPRNVHLLDGAGGPLGSIRDVLAVFVDEMRSTGSLSAVCNRNFEQPTFLRLKRSKKRHSVISIRADIKIEIDSLPLIPFASTGIVEFILEDLQSGVKRQFNRSIHGRDAK